MPNDAPAVAAHTILCATQPPLDELMRKALRGWHVNSVPTAFEALRALHSGAFDGYLLSYWLPDLAGTSLCREIRKVDPNAPVCVVSTTEDRAQRGRALRAGADAFIVVGGGPHPPVEETLQSLLRQSELRNIQAKVEEQRAIQDELERQTARVIERTRNAREQAARAIERSAKAKALSAYVAAGGSAAAFERTWQETFAAARQTPGRKAPSH